jgi:hypothetical protein
MRLWLGYPAAVVSSVGLVLWGVSVDKDWHWMVGQIAFFLCKSSPRVIWEVEKRWLICFGLRYAGTPNWEYGPVGVYC